MAVISTELHTRSNVVKQDLWADLGYCHTVVVVNDTAQTLAMGTVLGKVTADGKYKRAIETAVDGSKVADAIVIEAKTILGATNTNVLCLTRGPSVVSKSGMVIDATYNDAVKLAAVYASLEAKGISVLDTI